MGCGCCPPSGRCCWMRPTGQWGWPTGSGEAWWGAVARFDWAGSAGAPLRDACTRGSSGHDQRQRPALPGQGLNVCCWCGAPAAKRRSCCWSRLPDPACRAPRCSAICLHILNKADVLEYYEESVRAPTDL